MLKTRRGLSIFEDQKTQDQINENSKIPIFKDGELNSKLDKLVQITVKNGDYETVTQRTKEASEKKSKKTAGREDEDKIQIREKVDALQQKLC